MSIDNNNYAYPGKLHCSPQFRFIRAEGMHGWNIAIMEDQEPYTIETCKKLVAAYNEYDTLKAENERLKKKIEETQSELDLTTFTLASENKALIELNRELVESLTLAEQILRNLQSGIIIGRDRVELIGQKCLEILAKANSTTIKP